MSSENPVPPNSLATETSKGLPPVIPPSGRHIAQMFVVPFLIVSAVVLVLGGILWFVLAPHPPEHYLEGLRSSNTDVRWRTAEELANVLPRNETLATDPGFALDLTQLLAQWLKDNRQDEERSAAARARGEEVNMKELEEERASIKFLIHSLGRFYVPVAAPLLADLARGQSGGDAETVKQRKLDAVWALANLGERCQRYPDLPSDRRERIEAMLRLESAADSERGRWAREALDSLRTHSSPAVDRALEQCAKDPDLALEKYAALALAFWEGPSTDAALARLADHAGGPGPPGSATVAGLEIRYQATAALARRGSKQIDGRLDTLREMLDADHIGAVFRTRVKDQDVPDQTAIQATVTLALSSLVVLHRKRPDLDLSRMYPALDKLLDNPAFADEARATRRALEAH
jgi:hypothetical protein